MTDFLNSGLVEWGFTLVTESVVAGLALSCIASALSWAVISAVKLLHKFF